MPDDSGGGGGGPQDVSPAQLKQGLELETEQSHELVVTPRFQFST